MPDSRFKRFKIEFKSKVYSKSWAENLEFNFRIRAFQLNSKVRG